MVKLTCDNFKIANYRIYRNDRQNHPGGGSAICIRSSICHYPIDPVNCTIENTQLVAKIVTTDLQLISAYCSPKSNITIEDLRKLFTTNKPTIMMGDLNAKHRHWGCHVTNKSGKVISSFQDTNDILLHIPSQPTHYVTQGRLEILDIAMTYQITSSAQIEIISDLNSDHEPILMELDFDAQLFRCPAKPPINWNKFCAYLKQNSSGINPPLFFFFTPLKILKMKFLYLWHIRTKKRLKHSQTVSKGNAPQILSLITKNTR